jgi:hypothetical protein
MKTIGFHATLYGRICGGYIVCGIKGMEGYVSLYARLLSRCVGSVRLRSKFIGWIYWPTIRDRASCRVSVA